MAQSIHERQMGTHRVETLLDEATIRELDGWRAGISPSPSRSEAVRLLLEERLCGGTREQPVARSGRPRRPEADELGALYVLDRVSGFGPMKFREMHEASVDPRAAIKNPELLPFRGRTGEKLRTAIRALTSAEVAEGRIRAVEQLKRAERHSAQILVHGDAEYPKRVYASNNPVPVLYVRGDPAVWASRCSVAVVGSRKTREPYSSSARKFATTAAREGVVVISGFAMGADSIGHNAAQEARGGTVCVMPCGLDKVFPPENLPLWEELLAYPGAAFVSQFGFGQRASSLHLRKRNKLIVAFAQGIVVVQSAVDGGAMNAYRFGLEQKKPIATFKADGLKDTSGNAAIVQDPRTEGVAFELTSDESEYKTWLRRLSS